MFIIVFIIITFYLISFSCVIGINSRLPVEGVLPQIWGNEKDSSTSIDNGAANGTANGTANGKRKYQGRRIVILVNNLQPF